MIEFDFKITDQAAVRKIDKLADERGFAEKKLMARMGEGIISNTQTNYLRGQVLKRQSGNLANSLQYRIASEHSFKVGPGMVYGAAHEFGIPLGTRRIYPKNGKALRWYSNGRPVFARSVRQHVIKRPYLAPSITDYLNSGKAEREAERVLQDWLDRL